VVQKQNTGEMQTVKSVIRFICGIMTIPYAIYCTIRAFKEHDDIMLECYKDDYNTF